MKKVKIVNRQTNETFEFTENTFNVKTLNGTDIILTQDLKVLEIYPDFQYGAFEDIIFDDITHKFDIEVEVYKSYLCRVFEPVIPVNQFSTERLESQLKIVMAYNETEVSQKLRSLFDKNVKFHIEQIHETVI